MKILRRAKGELVQACMDGAEVYEMANGHGQQIWTIVFHFSSSNPDKDS